MSDLAQMLADAKSQGYAEGATDMENAKQIIIDGLLKQIEQIRAEAIDEFAEDMLNKIIFEEKWLFCCKSNNADTNIVFSSLKTFIKSRAEQLKEQKQVPKRNS